MKTIFRSEMSSNFTTLPNAMLRDSRLSFKARGLLAMALSNRDDWEIRPMSLTTELEGESKIRSALLELRELGYCEMKKLKDDAGHFYCLWTFRDAPSVENPNAENPNADFPHAENRPAKEEQGERKTSKEENKGKGEDASLDKKNAEAISALIVESWNNTAGLKKVIALTPQRVRTLNARISELYFLEHWPIGLMKIAASDFCRGKNDRQWTADFDFFIRPGTLVKVMEGKYDNRTGASKPVGGNF